MFDPLNRPSSWSEGNYTYVPLPQEPRKTYSKTPVSLGVMVKNDNGNKGPWKFFLLIVALGALYLSYKYIRQKLIANIKVIEQTNQLILKK